MSDKDLEVLAYKNYSESKFLDGFSFTKSMCYVGGFVDGYKAAEAERQMDGELMEYFAQITNSSGELVCGRWCKTLTEATDWIVGTKLSTASGGKAKIVKFDNTSLNMEVVFERAYYSATDRMVNWAKERLYGFVVSFPQDLVNEFIKEQESKKS